MIDIIDTCLREIDDRLFLDSEGRDVTDVDAAYTAKGGVFIVLEIDGEVIGTHATLPVDLDQGVVTFRRLYLKRAFRGQRHGQTLMRWAIDWSRQQGFKEVSFWSDIRFTRAHHFFESFGFERGKTRDMNDSPLPYSEYHFRLQL